MIRLGCPAYLNSKALVYGLDPNQYSISFDTPSSLQKKLAQGEIDIGLLPVVAYLENPVLKILPGMGICSRGPVQSVGLFPTSPKINLLNVKKMKLDPASLTSRKLCQILLTQNHGRSFNEISWDEPKDFEMELLIGDTCLTQSESTRMIDLGEAWQQWTQKPFVYACWMTHLDHLSHVVADLHAALAQGLKNLEKIAHTQKIIRPELAWKYLTQNIYYELGNHELDGLKTFFQYIKKMEQTEHDHPIEFVA